MKLKQITEKQWESAVPSRAYAGKYEELRAWIKTTDDGQIEIEEENKKALNLAVLAAQNASRRFNKTLKVKYLTDTKAYLCILPV